MVFIAVGTQKQKFKRLFDIVEKSKYLDGKEIIAQAGYSKYDSKKVKIYDFMPQEDIDKYIQNSEFVICHGGVGTIFEALKYNKKILVIPRLKKYKEHKNDHQLEICNELQRCGYLLYLNEEDDIDEKLNQLQNTEFKKYAKDDNCINILKTVI